MYCIGLTGTIASGKSTVASQFSGLGIDVISADLIAKKLTASDQPAFENIIKKFGPSVLAPTGELDRQHLRELIFNSTQDRSWLENLLHPLIREQIRHEIGRCQSPYCLIEIPLLTDKSDYPYLNRVLLVLADHEQQITRLGLRDNSSRQQTLAILKTQADERTLRALANDVLMNDGSLDRLHEKIVQLHEQYLKEAMNSQRD